MKELIEVVVYLGWMILIFGLAMLGIDAFSLSVVDMMSF